jgi:TonB family protein
MFSTDSMRRAPAGWRQRLFGASGASVVIHVSLFLAALVFLNTTPPPEAYHVRPMRTELIVRLPMSGDAGGGGGHPAPAAAKELSIPRSKPPDPMPVEPPKATVEPKPLPTLDAQVMTNSATMLQAAGTSSVTIAAPGGGGPGTGVGPGRGPGVGPGRDGGYGDGPRRPGAGVTNPVPLLQPRPNYTVEAMRGKVSGEVILEAVIEANGTVSSLKVLKGLPFGLNEEAMKAAKEWLFKPAIADGKPVPIIVTLILEFQLR